MTSTGDRGAVPRLLEGRVVLVTRPPETGPGSLATMLEDRGATVVAAPAIRIEPPADAEPLRTAARGLLAGEFEWVVLTSAAGVEALLSAVGDVGERMTIRARVAAVGEGTAAALRRRGLAPTFVPPEFTTDALAAAMPEGTGRVLLPRADIAPSALEDALEAKGWTPHRVDAYRTVLADALPEAARAALHDRGVDAVTFTSASTVRGFAAAAASLPPSLLEGPGRPGFACIGPVTASEAEDHGLPVDAVARPHTIEGLVRALERLLGPAGAESEDPTWPSR